MAATQMARLHPSATLPGLLVPQVQDVPFEKYIGNATNFGSMSKEAIYLTSVTNINSETQVGQQWGSQRAKQSYTLGQISAPYYRIEAYLEWNIIEQAKFEELSNGVALPNFLENLAQQGINQRIHEAILYGFDPATELSQGILANATTSTLPQDSNKKDTITGYNVAELQAFLSGIVREVMNASYGMLRPVTIASSSRVINYLLTAIVPLTESQQPGSGVDTVAGLANRVMSWLGAGQVEFIRDETLIDETNTIGDKIVFIARGMDNQQENAAESQNLVGQFNSITFNTWFDRAEGLMQFDVLPSAGVQGKILTYKMTPGITLRSEAVCVVTAKYA